MQSAYVLAYESELSTQCPNRIAGGCATGEHHRAKTLKTFLCVENTTVYTVNGLDDTSYACCINLSECLFLSKAVFLLGGLSGAGHCTDGGPSSAVGSWLT